MATQHMAQSPIENSQIAALWRRVRAGEDDAWNELEPICKVLIEGWARRARLQPVDLEDLIQDVLIAILRKAHAFDERLGDESFRAWLCGITEHKIEDVERARQMHQTVQLDMDNLTAPAATEPGEPAAPCRAAAEAIAAIERVRSSFRLKTFQAFWLTAVEGRLPKAVAEELQMSAIAVYQAKHRMLANVQEELLGGSVQTTCPMPALGFEIFLSPYRATACAPAVATFWVRVSAPRDVLIEAQVAQVPRNRHATAPGISFRRLAGPVRGRARRYVATPA